jgi:hypothetical protein
VIDVMVKKVSLVTTDDLDCSPDAETVFFGQDGVNCEIDLGPANKTQLANAAAMYIAADGRSAAADGGACLSPSLADASIARPVPAWAASRG